jgi:tetraacyldisaccharide 4'-kinase
MSSMRAPEFWWRPKPNLAARLLSPIGWIYGAVTARRMARSGQRCALPVLCVGNFVAGGAGKTPTAIAIAKSLLAKGQKPVFLTRGYHSKITPLPCLVDPTRHSAEDVGDEALLLARVAPTIIGADRAASAELAQQIGASLLILDDGLQNPSLVHDFRLVVVDARTGIGNGLCIPAGPMRAPFSGQLASVSALLFIGDGERAAGLRETAKASGKPVLSAKLSANQEMKNLLERQKVLAFAGIGLPQKLLMTLETLGAHIAGWRAFPDHHAYPLAELQRLQIEAGRLGAYLVTTEKDFVRIAPFLQRLDPDLPLPIALPVSLVFDDEDELDRLLAKITEASALSRI